MDEYMAMYDNDILSSLRKACADGELGAVMAISPHINQPIRFVSGIEYIIIHWHIMCI